MYLLEALESLKKNYISVQVAPGVRVEFNRKLQKKAGKAPSMEEKKERFQEAFQLEPEVAKSKWDLIMKSQEPPTQVRVLKTKKVVEN